MPLRVTEASTINNAHTTVNDSTPAAPFYGACAIAKLIQT